MEEYCKSWSKNAGVFNGGRGACNSIATDNLKRMACEVGVELGKKGYYPDNDDELANWDLYNIYLEYNNLLKNVKEIIVEESEEIILRIILLLVKIITKLLIRESQMEFYQNNNVKHMLILLLVRNGILRILGIVNHLVVLNLSQLEEYFIIEILIIKLVILEVMLVLKAKMKK